jgi:hypothetical protein
MTRSIHSTDLTLLALGFTAGDDGTLRAPDGSTVTLTPMGRFYRLTVTLPAEGACSWLTGDVVHCVVAKIAVKITPEPASEDEKP